MSRLPCLQYVKPWAAEFHAATNPTRKRCFRSSSQGLESLSISTPSSLLRRFSENYGGRLWKGCTRRGLSLDFRIREPPCLGKKRFSARAVAKAEEGGDERHVIVCGGGVIGVCTAFYLATQGARVTIVERNDVAGGASGKAGGLLGLDWYEGEPIGVLSRKGFLLHADLAHQLDGATAYKYGGVGHITVNLTPPPADLEAALPSIESMKPSVASPEEPEEERDPWEAGFAIIGEKPDLPVEIPEWLDGPVAKEGGMVNGTRETIALLHPGLFTKRLLAEATEKHGVKVHAGTVQSIVFDTDASHTATGVMVDCTLVRGDAVVVAMGPWSGTLDPISSLCPFRALRGDSIVLRPKGPIGPISSGPCVSLFMPESVSERVEEIYLMPRPTGEVYVGGINRIERGLPNSSADVLPNPPVSESLAKLAALSTSTLEGATLEATQACLRPFAGDDGLPLIGAVPDHSNLYVATGHGYWGILTGPATGLALSELILTGSSRSLDLEPYNPGRYVRAAGP